MSHSSFSDEAVPLDLLRQRAFNLRWAQQEPDIIPLTAADPDFPICPAIQERLIGYVRDGVMSYAPAEGLPDFRAAVADWMRATRALHCTPDAVFATDSAASAMAVVARASLQAGDEVLIPDPVDFLFQHTIARTGAVPVRIPLTATTSAEAFIEAMSRHLTPRTRMLWLCNPHNPLGVVYPPAWLEQVASWAIEHGLRILADEIWSDIVYTPHRHTNLAALLPESAAKIVTVKGFSKNFALAGMRVGCLICTDAQWRREILAASDADSTVYGVSVLSQVAVIAALREGQDWLQAFVTHLQAQRDYVMTRLSVWPGVHCHLPQGTYVAFPNISALSDDAETLCGHLREQARVALVPGAARWFGPAAAGHLRLCFSTSRHILQTAFDRLEPIVLELAAAQGK